MLGIKLRHSRFFRAVASPPTAGLSVIAQAKSACGGNLDEVEQWVRLTGYINSADDFSNQPKVLNGASDLLQSLFGESGLHARAAAGVNALPFNVAVETEAILEIRRCAEGYTRLWHANF